VAVELQRDPMQRTGRPRELASLYPQHPAKSERVALAKPNAVPRISRPDRVLAAVVGRAEPSGCGADGFIAGISNNA